MLVYLWAAVMAALVALEGTMALFDHNLLTAQITKCLNKSF